MILLVEDNRMNQAVRSGAVATSRSSQDLRCAF
jgi:hypothetical protein